MSENTVSLSSRRRKREPEEFGDNPNTAQCCYFMERKHRFCRMEKKLGSRFCATHHMEKVTSLGEDTEAGPIIKGSSNHDGGATCSPINETSVSTLLSSENQMKGKWERVPCLINPNHTVYACRLAKHIRVCPDLRHVTSNLPYYARDKHSFRNTIIPDFHRTIDETPQEATSSRETQSVPNTLCHAVEEAEKKTPREDSMDSQEGETLCSPIIDTTTILSTVLPSALLSLSSSSAESPTTSAAVNAASHSTKEKRNSNESSTPHKNVPPDRLTVLIEKVRKCYETYVEHFMFIHSPIPCGKHYSNENDTSCAEEWGSNETSSSSTFWMHLWGTAQEEKAIITNIHEIGSHIGEEGSIKHTPQHIGLMKMLDYAIMRSRLPSLKKPIYGILELGAGKGGLAIAFQRLLTTYMKELREISSSSSLCNPSILSNHFFFLSHQWSTPPCAFTLCDSSSSAEDAEEAPQPPTTTAHSSTFLPLSAKASSCYPHIVVIDVQTFRRKGDCKVCRSVLPIQRLRVDLKDLYLTKAFLCGAIPGREHLAKEAVGNESTGKGRQDTSLGSSPVSSCSPYCCSRGDEQEMRREKEENTLEWVAVGKHLCGAATEFALSCLSEPELPNVAKVSIRCLVLATCCHHRCAFTHMLPQATTTPRSALSAAPAPQEDTTTSHPPPFTAPTAARKGIPERREHESESPSSFLFSSTSCSELPCLTLPGTDFSLNKDEFAAVASMSSWAVSGANVEPSKQCIGYMCKRIIDSYRVAYLRSIGFQAYLATYIPRSITEENVCIIAFK